MRKAKILVTLGPSSSEPGQLRRLFEAGADGVRLNFSHGTHDEHRARTAAVREVARQIGREVSILGDLCGPKLRVGRFANQSVTLAVGSLFGLTTRDVVGSEQEVNVSHPLHKDLSIGDHLLLDDGLISMIVERVRDDGVVCRVTVGGVLSDHKGVNVPNVRLSIPAITPKDEQDLQFGKDIGVDWFALSFVRDVQDVVRCKALAAHIPVIAKLEKPEALQHLGAIIAAADGVMVARGDLGVEMGPEQVPVAQKRIIDLANRGGKLVITATQMLDSMIHNPRPTRAEASDVANAIFDGSDVVMLSGETAAGKYPDAAVAMMRSIIDEVEQSEIYGNQPAPDVYLEAWATDNATARAAAVLSRQVPLKVLVVWANGPEWIDLIADYRPRAPVLALVSDVQLARRIALQWGIVPRVVQLPSSQQELIELSVAEARAAFGAEPGDEIAVLAPCLPQRKGRTLTIWQVD